MGSGGRRIGAGGKPKALSDKLELGQTSGSSRVSALTVLEHTNPVWSEPEGQPLQPPKPSSTLTSMKPVKVKNMAVKIFRNTWTWLAERNCADFVQQDRLELYAMSVARRIQAETDISLNGLTDAEGKVNPNVKVSMEYRKAADTAWTEIFQIVKENSSVGYADSPHDDAMERLLGSG